MRCLLFSWVVVLLSFTCGLVCAQTNAPTTNAPPAVPEPPPQPVDETVPPLSNNYPPGPDSKPQPGIAAGQSFKFDITDSKVFPGTKRTISVYVPAAYTVDKPACVAIFLDGIGFKAQTVFDNLIAQHAMPVTIAIGVSPGHIDAIAPTNPRFDRSFELDNRTDRLARFILEEVLPAVEAHPAPDGKAIHLSHDPNDLMTAGGSTGGIAAFNLAFQRPDAFRRVFSSIGTFVGMRGGEGYYVIVRKTEPAPLRVFMEDGVHDEWMGGPEIGDWWMSNLTMERALEFAGYDVNHAWGVGNHNGNHAALVFPDAMKWLWRDWPAPIVAGKPGNPVLAAVLKEGEGWQVAAEHVSTVSLTAGNNGDVYFRDKTSHHTMRLPVDGSAAVEMIGTVPDYFIFDAKATKTGLEGPPKLTDSLTPRGMTTRSDGGFYVSVDKPDGSGELWFAHNSQPVRVAEGLKGASGLALSPDGLWLFAAQAHSRYGMSYRVQADGTLDSGEPFYDFAVPAGADDPGAGQVGMDSAGRPYVATRMGVMIFDRNGRTTAIIPLPGHEEAFGLCFGGADFSTLYVSVGDKIYRRHLQIPGVAPWAPPIALPKWGAG